MKVAPFFFARASRSSQTSRRHCEERSDEAVHGEAEPHGFVSLPASGRSGEFGKVTAYFIRPDAASRLPGAFFMPSPE